MAADLEFRIGAELSEIKGALTQLRSDFQKTGQAIRQTTQGADFKGLEAGIGKLNAQVGGAISLIKTLASSFLAMKAIDAFGSLIKQGIEFNSSLESARLGIASIISAQANLVNAQGKAVTGQEALAVAIGLSDKQMRELRIAGLETAATTVQLVQAYQAAIGAGIQAGLTLDEIRTVTIQITQAAGALGVPMFQLNQEVRSILDGTIDINSRVATTLGITNAQVQNWKQQHKLVDELNKRMGAFSEAGKLAADTWTVIKSNAVEALQAISGEITGGMFEQLKQAVKDATSGLFDTKALAIAEPFRDLVGLARELATEIGRGIGGAITGIVKLAQDFSGWIKENKADIDELLGSLGLVLRSFGDIVSAAFSLVGGLSDAGVKLSVFATILQTVSVLIAGVQDGFRLIAGIVVGIGATIITVLIAPLERFLAGLAAAMAPVSKAASEALREASANLRSIGQRGFEAAGEILAPIAKGEGAVARAIKRLDTLTVAAKKAGDEQTKAANKSAELGRVVSPKNKPPVKNPADASDIAAAAQKLLKDQTERAVRSLQNLYDDSLIATRVYYAERARIQSEAIDAEIAVEQKRLKQVQAGSKDALQATTQIKLLERQKAEIAIQAERDKNKTLKELDKDREQLRIQDLQNAHKDVEAARLKAEAQFRDLRKRLEAEGDTAGVALIDKLIQRAGDDAAISQLEEKLSLSFGRVQQAQEDARSRLKLGLIDERTAEDDVTRARKDSIPVIEAQIAKLEELAAATGDEKLLAKLAEYRTKLGELKNQQSATFERFKAMETDALTGFFEDLASGATSAADALKKLVVTFVQGIARMAAEALAKKAAFALFGGGGGGGGAGGGVIADILASVFHEGGSVGGPSRGRRVNMLAFLNAPRLHTGVNGLGLKPDEHAAILQTGEDVVARNDPRNSRNGGGAGSGYRIVNVLDPALVSGYLESAQGERTVLNIIGRNPGQVKQMIGN